MSKYRPDRSNLLWIGLSVLLIPIAYVGAYSQSNENFVHCGERGAGGEHGKAGEPGEPGEPGTDCDE